VHDAGEDVGGGAPRELGRPQARQLRVGPELGPPTCGEPERVGGADPEAHKEPQGQRQDRDERISDHDATVRILIRQGEAVRAFGSIRPAST